MPAIVVLGPKLHVSAYDATSFTLTVDATSGSVGTLLWAGCRNRGTNDNFVFQSFGAPTVGQQVIISGLATGPALEWRSFERSTVPVTITYEGTSGNVNLIASNALATQFLDETVAQLNLCQFNGIGNYQVCKGRALKPQAKKLQIQCYMGKLDTQGRPGGTGSTWKEWQVIVVFYHKKTDLTMGGQLSEDMGLYMDEAFDRLDKLRPDDLVAPINNFFMTQASVSDIDITSGPTKTGTAQDNEIVGFFAVNWGLWRPTT